MKPKIIGPITFFFFLAICLSGCYRPTTHIKEQRYKNAEKDLYCIHHGIEEIPHTLSLDDIIEIALKRNFDLRAKQKEWEALMNKAVSEDLKMLPSLIANGELSNRNNDQIVSSESVEPGVPPAPPSISTQKHVIRYGINLVFNLIDFGLAFYRGRQEANQALIKQMEYYRLIHQLVVDITEQYWVAIAAKRAIERSAYLLEFAEALQYKINEQINDSVLSRSEGFRGAADLIGQRLQMRSFNKDYHQAISALALKMGLPPNFVFELIDTPMSEKMADIDNICALEEIALKMRPELYTGDLEENIAEDEVRSAFLQMIPGIELFTGDYYDANKYYTNNHWLIAGARATWNLFSLPSRFRYGKSAMRQQEVTRIRRIALSVGVLSQVRLAHILYQDNFEQFELTQELNDAFQNLLAASKEEYEEGIISGREFFTVQSRALLSEVNAIKAYGELQVSLEELNHSVGLPRYYKTQKCNHEVGELCQTQ